MCVFMLMLIEIYEHAYVHLCISVDAGRFLCVCVCTEITGKRYVLIYDK